MPNEKNKKSMYSYMRDRASMGETNPGSQTSGNPIYRREPQAPSYQDSMAAYLKIKGKAAGAENLKPVGQPKKYVGMQPAKPKKK
jgi:hypothetical protein